MGSLRSSYWELNNWLDARPAILAVCLVLSPVVALVLYAAVTDQSYGRAIRHGLVFGVAFGGVTMALRYRDRRR